jgi:DegV family protein with EDD domain
VRESGPGRVAIVTDSTSDVPADEASRLGVTIIPAVLIVEGKSYLDGQAFSRTQLYRQMASLEGLPTTAVPSPGSFAEAYERQLHTGAASVLSIHLAHRLSGMVQTATQAAGEFAGRVEVLDSGQVSLGLGFQVLEAAVAALAGAPLDVVRQVALAARRNVRLIAMLNTLEFVRRSGRVSWLRANLGEMLNVKQLVEVVDGTIRRLDRIRTRPRAVQALRALAAGWGSLSRLGVLHTAAAEEAAALGQELRPRASRPPLVVEVTTVIGAHVGPESIGLVGLLA